MYCSDVTNTKKAAINTQSKLVIYVIALVASILLTGKSLPERMRLWQRGRMTSAMVTNVDYTNHNNVTYKYIVDGQKYERVRSSNIHVAPGQTIWIHYLPEAPRVSTLDNPKSDFVSLATAVAIAALIQPLVALLGVQALMRVFNGKRS
jgi:hypothetical protein